MPAGNEPWPVVADEEARLSDLGSFRILHTEPEAEFDRIVDLASDLLGTPVALLTLVGEREQWFKARVGFGLEQTSRHVSLCAHTITGDGIFEVTDAADDARFADNALVTGGPKIRFYAGAPLTSSDGHKLGSLCVIDTNPRPPLSDRDRRILRGLASLAMEKLELRRLRLAEKVAAEFAAATADAFLCLDPEGRISFWNPAAERLFGYSRPEALGQSLDIIMPERLRGAHDRGMRRVAAGAPSKLAGKTIELVAVRRGGEEFPIEMLISTWQAGEAVGIGAVIRDISERRIQQQRLEHMALNDQLTGLANRFQFSQQLGAALSSGKPTSVLLLDLDGFKEVNDTLGHGAGDTVLQAIAIRLLAAVEREWTVARLGGDEFAVLVPDSCDPIRIDAAAAALIATLVDPIRLELNDVQLGSSVGMALAPLQGTRADELLANADLALYAAKSEGGNKRRLYEPSLRNRMIEKRALRAELRRAVANREFVLHYQPQVRLSDRSLVGCEALLRWQHPERGLLYPGSFIDELEGSPLAEKLGWWILDEACRQMAVWRGVGLPVQRMGVNLFAAQFRSGRLEEQVAAALESHQLAPNLLELEITETIALQQNDSAAAPLRALRDLGVGLAFDDFGTGYASLSTLKRFPLTRLKIDKGFVRDLETDPHDAAIVRAVVAMGKSFGLEIIAEGVETASQEAELRAMLCDEGQGYLFGKGLAFEQFESRFGPTKIRAA